MNPEGSSNYQDSPDGQRSSPGGSNPYKDISLDHENICCVVYWKLANVMYNRYDVVILVHRGVQRVRPTGRVYREVPLQPELLCKL